MCTCFAVYSQDKAVSGMNFDTDNIKLKLKIIVIMIEIYFTFQPY